MAKVINSYEALYIINAQLSDEEIKGLVDKFTTLVADNGTVDTVDEWGKRRLAYPINDMEEGYYVLLTFKSESAFPAELERVMGITDGILRYMVIRLEEKKAKSKPAPVKEAEEAPAVAENAEA
ncbi:MAG: 30S ribosomal protein S6 [Clostridia bacterium]|nr:30S ribosomal protein S6 [Clostridia bacterium]